MAADEFTLPHLVHLSHLRLRRQGAGSEDNGEPETFPAEEHLGSLQHVPNDLLRMAFLRGETTCHPFPPRYTIILMRKSDV